MSEQMCPICDYRLKDGDKVVAIVTSTFVNIPSDVSYAITQPEKCIEVVHDECYDWEDYPDEDGPEGMVA